MLIAALRRRLGDPGASSFQLVGEALQLVTIDDLRASIVEAPPELLAEEAALGAEAYAWLRKYNRSLYGRIAGYWALGERMQHRYPWPIVAILGIVQVLGGMHRARLYGLAGAALSRLGFDRYEKLGDGSEDVLRRTNRGIFADSVPSVLRALRAEALIKAGNHALADELVAGRAAVLWDEESRALCRSLVDGLLLADPDAQFRALSRTTLEHFAREQAIFTHHIGARSKKRKLPPAKSVPAPVIAHGALSFEPYHLPRGFDFRDHDTRVREFGKAFVESVTRSRADFSIAVAWVRRHFA